MKKCYLFLFLICLGNIGHAQTAASYCFSGSTGTYTSISGTGTFIPVSGDDNTYTDLPLPFSFSYCGSSYSTISVCTNGWLSLSNSSDDAYDNSTTSDFVNGGTGMIMPFWDDNEVSGTAAVYYQVTGAVGSRIYTVEWKNNKNHHNLNDSGNYQVKLYEGTNVIKLCYGAAVYNAVAGTGTIGIANSTSDFQVIQGGIPTSASASTTAYNDTLKIPANTGVIYTYAPPPSLETFTGGGGYCAGSTGASIGLTLTESGVNYQLFQGATSVSAIIPGSGPAITFGTTYTTVGYYHAVATNASIPSCTTTLPGVTVSINPLPDTFTMSGGGHYCAGGTGVNVGLDNSVVGVNYQLYKGITAVGSPVSGTGSALGFGLQTAAGVYTAIATNAITLCTKNMAGIATVTIDPLPTPFHVTPTNGTYCLFASGVTIGLDSSETGVKYQLVYLGLFNIGGTVAGTGHPIGFGAHIPPGAYTVVATNTVTACTNNMIGSSTVNLALPPAFHTVTVFNGGNYCVGDTGVHIGLNGSNTGVKYQLYRHDTAVGSSLAGTGTAIDFGLYTAVGTYTVSAIDTTTGCKSNMLNTVTVIINPLVVPTVNLSTGIGAGNAVCYGVLATFTAQTRNGGAAPTYTWTINNIPVGATDSTYSYLPTDGEHIKVILRSNAQCARPDTAVNTMIVNVDTLIAPSVFINVSPITSIAPGTTVTLTAIPTNGGPTPLYQWLKNGTPIPGATTAVYSNNNFVNHDTLCCRMTSSGGCGGVVTFNCVTLTVYPAGVTQVTVANDIKLLPNPNTGEFVVKGTLGSQANEEVSIEVTNMLGQVIYTNKAIAHNGAINEKIELGNSLPNGMYLLNLKSTNEHNVFRFVIEK